MLLVQGAWPGAEATIAAESPAWSGLGSGYGYLDRGEATIAVTPRRGSGTRRGRIVLAGGGTWWSGGATPTIEDPDAAGHLETIAAPDVPLPLRAVG